MRGKRATLREDDPPHSTRHPLRPPDDRSAARRLAWAVVGVGAFFAATHSLGWW